MSDSNFGKVLEVHGLWPPVFFHGDDAWLAKVSGGWSLSVNRNLQSKFPMDFDFEKRMERVLQPERPSISAENAAVAAGLCEDYEMVAPRPLE